MRSFLLLVLLALVLIACAKSYIEFNYTERTVVDSQKIEKSPENSQNNVDDSRKNFGQPAPEWVNSAVKAFQE